MAPHLFVIAGPNGSGKSIFSKTLVQTDFEVFDGDKYVTRLRQQFPETGSDALLEYVNENEFRAAKDLAISARGNFAFETNFSSSDPVKSLKEFKAEGYKTHLIFMGMNSIEECVQRVSLRVKSGGHKVSEESICYNFEHGYANLYKHYREFDTVTLIDNGIPTEELAREPIKVLFWETGNIELYEQKHADWIKKFLNMVSA